MDRRNLLQAAIVGFTGLFTNNLTKDNLCFENLFQTMEFPDGVPVEFPSPLYGVYITVYTHYMTPKEIRQQAGHLLFSTAASNGIYVSEEQIPKAYDKHIHVGGPLTLLLNSSKQFNLVHVIQNNKHGLVIFNNNNIAALLIKL